MGEAQVVTGAGGFALLLLALGVATLYLAVSTRSFAGGLALFVVLTFFDQVGIAPATRLAGVLLVMLWLLIVTSRPAAVPLLPRDRRLFAAAILVFAGWVVASTVWAFDFHEAFGSAVRLLQGLSLLFVVYTAMREPRHIRWLVIAFVTGALISSVIGLGHAASGSRITGGFDDPNELAAVIVPAVAMSGFGFYAARGLLLRWLFLGALPIFALALFATDSQGGLMALFAAAAGSIILGGPVRKYAVAAVSGGALLAAFYYTAVTTPPSLTEGESSRVDLWRVALEVSADYPLTGVGAGNFPVVEPDYALSTVKLFRVDLVLRPEVAHNTYLHILAEYGVCGLALFLCVAAGSLYLGVRSIGTFARRGDRTTELFARGVTVAAVANLTASVFVSGQYEKQLWLLLALTASLDAVAGSETRLRVRAGGARASPAPVLGVAPREAVRD
jgi:O-antigen ligase